MKELKIATIYPEYLCANGDRGNALMLANRAQINGVGFSYKEIALGENFSPADYDFYYLGGVADEFNPVVVKAILERKDIFHEIKELSKTVLGVGFGYQILGNDYTFMTEEKLECLSLIDFFTIDKPKRQYGNLISKMVFMSPNYLVGFENHRGATYLNKSAIPLSFVDKGFGNNGSDKTEGAITKNVFGTYLTGPVLVRNVYFADYLLKITMETKYQELFGLVDEENTLEEDVHIDFIEKRY